MEVVAPHMVGEFKYIILHTLAGKESPVRVYLDSAEITVKPVDDEDEGRCLSVSIWYKAHDKFGLYRVNGNNIYDTREDALRKIEYNLKNRENKV